MKPSQIIIEGTKLRDSIVESIRCIERAKAIIADAEKKLEIERDVIEIRYLDKIIARRVRDIVCHEQAIEQARNEIAELPDMEEMDAIKDEWYHGF